MFGTSTFQNTAPPSNIHIIVLKDAGCQLPNYNLASASSWVNLWGFREWPCNISDNISCCAFLKLLFGGFFLTLTEYVHSFYLSIALAFTRGIINESFFDNEVYQNQKLKVFQRCLYPFHLDFIYTIFIYICIDLLIQVLSIYRGILFCVMAHNR